MTFGVDPRADARALVGGRFQVRVLEPSLPAVLDPPWLADDPVNATVDDDLPVVSPVANTELTWDELAREDERIAPWCADHWLGGWRALEPVTDLDALVRTRAAWHAVAERVLAPVRHAANGRIGLRFTSGGFGTPYFADAGESVQLRVERTELLVARAGTPHTLSRIGLHDAARTTPELDPVFAAVPTNADLGYRTTTSLTSQVVGAADATSARILGDWYGFACSVLEEIRSGAPDADATRCQLWPEHFDLAIELGDADTDGRAAFGASPGDAAHPEPYLYVAPWTAPAADPYWNDTAFGGSSLSYATLTGDPLAARTAALEFFASARQILDRS